MSRVIQISIIGRISGNVNADEVIGQRITLKKMYSTSGEVLPFVSARAVKRAIREALKNMGFEIDRFISGRKAALELSDSGRPDKLIDNDIFGYMYTIGKRERAISRQAPIALSYFKAIKDTPIKAEFAARFPRDEGNPVPFEVEVADFIGKINCIIYDYIGDFTRDNNPNVETKILPLDERVRRLEAFLEVFLTPKYVLPRRTNSLNIPEYISSLITLSNIGPLPIYQYHSYDFNHNMIDFNLLAKLKDVINEKESVELYYIDYKGTVSRKELPDIVKLVKLEDVIERASSFLFEK